MADEKGMFPPVKKGTAIAQDGSHIKVPLQPVKKNGGSHIKTPLKPIPTGSNKEK
jgi:hypothetical protein